MQNEQSSEETHGLFESIKEFIDTIEESENSEIKVNGIISLFKILIQHLEADDNVSSHQSELLHSLNESQQANMECFIELYDRITKLEKNVIDIASNSSKLAEEVVKLAETAKKIPVINIDKLLKTLNEHSEEINENAASIKVIKDKLIN